MNYDNGFKLSDMFSDEKYKARFFLLVFGVLFVILIILVRTTGGNNTNNTANTNTANNNNNNNQTNVTQIQDVNPTESDLADENSLYNRFSFLRLNNYELNFNVKAGKEIKVTGVRFDNKYNLEVTSGKESFNYQARNNMVKVKINNEYQTTDFPYVLFDYFDNNMLYYILINAEKVNEEDNIVKYVINNEKMLNVLPSNVSSTIYVEDKSLKNDIVLTLNNNKINKIDLDLTNLIKKTNELNELIISLEYSNIGQINDFNIEF